MERKKRVYPAQPPKMTWLKGLLLAATAAVVLSGIGSGGDFSEFAVERLQEENSISLDEAFDETMTETTVQLPAESWFALQMGVFESEESAVQASEVYRKRGAAGYLWKDGRWRVLAAVYPDRDSAQLVRSQLREDHNIDSYLYEIAFPEVSMKLTGMQGQLDILKAAFGHAPELARQLQSLSVALDRQELSCAEVCERLDALAGQIEVVVLRLEQRFPKPFHQTVGALAACFEQFLRFAGEVSQQESAFAMGVMLKNQSFATLEEIQKVYQTLQNT